MIAGLRARAALAALALALTSCVSTVGVPLTSLNIQPGAGGIEFTPAQVELVHAASASWGAAVPEARMPVGQLGESRGGTIQPTTGKSCDGPRVGYAVIRATTAPRIFVCVDDVAGDPLVFYLVVLHEIGHALATRGDHLDAGNTMYRAIDTRSPNAGELTDEDVRYVREGMGL